MADDQSAFSIGIGEPTPVTSAIDESIRTVHLALKPSKGPFKGDKIQTGQAREVAVSKFVASFFPPSYRVVKGPIHAINGSSREVDCVLVSANHPNLETPMRQVILAEGVHAAIEVKPDISVLNKGGELHRALQQCSSVKRLIRRVTRVRAPFEKPPGDRERQLYDKIPYLILAGKTQDLSRTREFLQSQANANGLQSEDLPDAIVALDQGVIYHSAMAKRCPFAKLLEEHEPGYPEDLFIEFKFRERSEIPAFFIWLLCSFPSPEPTWEGFMVGKYLSFRSVDATVVFGAPHDDQT